MGIELGQHQFLQITANPSRPLLSRSLVLERDLRKRIGLAQEMLTVTGDIAHLGVVREIDRRRLGGHQAPHGDLEVVRGKLGRR